MDAVRNLIYLISSKITEFVDTADLWKIPHKYIEAIKAGGSFWATFCAVFLGESNNPKRIISCIGDNLLRLKIRLIVFVDDFDRIEEDSFASQQAVAKALNQLQSVPNIQYIISVGRTHDINNEENNGKRSWDLLKITRFQELVPK